MIVRRTNLDESSTSPPVSCIQTRHTYAPSMMLMPLLTHSFCIILFYISVEAVITSTKYRWRTGTSSGRIMTCHSTKIMMARTRLECAYQCATARCYGVALNYTMIGEGNCILCAKCSTTAAAAQIIVNDDFMTLHKKDLILPGE